MNPHTVALIDQYLNSATAPTVQFWYERRMATVSALPISRPARVGSARIPSLDGLRAISIAFVLISHLAYERFFNPNTLHGTALTSLGGFGVKIFFVISGYLITLLMLNEEKQTRDVSLRQFYLRRAFRILPAALTFMAAIFIYNGSAIPLQNKVLSFLFLANYANPGDWHVEHLWSLGVEEQFYLLWPLLFIALPRIRKKALILTIVLVPIANVAIIRFGWPFWNTAFYSVADTIACGCLLALVRQNRYLGKILDSQLFFLVPILTCIDAPLILLKGGLVFGLCKSLLLRPALNIGIALSVEKAVRTAPAFLNWKPIMFIGTLSYSLYLWQQPFAFSRTPLSPNSIIDLLLRILLIGSLATASYFLVERPFLKVRRHIITESHR
jgi:peptidoglycan/LPS O-acetylase OafA/YrhL